MAVLDRAHASHSPNRIVGGGMRRRALAMLVSQPPPPCLACARGENNLLRTRPPTQPPLKGGRVTRAALPIADASLRD